MCFRGSAGLAFAATALVTLCGCILPRATNTRDVMIVAGREVHTGTRVITWKQPSGYSAYAYTSASKSESFTRRQRIDQIVLHYDGCGTSKLCFEALRSRGLTVHFLVDLDGTVYQILDIADRATHATISNDRSIGIEIANIGAFQPHEASTLDSWYYRRGGQTFIRVPRNVPASATANWRPDFHPRPARIEPVRGILQNRTLIQYDFTPQQYIALTKLTSALCHAFPTIPCDAPYRGRGREVVAEKLSPDVLDKFRGILGHYHIQENKVDPGPAFQWEQFLDNVRRDMVRHAR